jgi:hypothetical protein
MVGNDDAITNRLRAAAAAGGVEPTRNRRGDLIATMSGGYWLTGVDTGGFFMPYGDRDMVL